MISPEPLALHIVTGVDETCMSLATMNLQWEADQSVVLRHDIDAEASTLHRTVSDMTGVLDTETISLAHACVACAVREDILPMLQTLADLGRWNTIILRLPTAAPAAQVCRALAHDPALGAQIKVASVVAAFDGQQALENFTGDKALQELNLHHNDDDQRGIAETCAELAEYADVVAIYNTIDAAELAFIKALMRPDAITTDGWSAAATLRVARKTHDTATTESHTDYVKRSTPAAPTCEHVWTLTCESDRPFHPERLYENIETLGGGWYRSKGAFWLPTRPREVCCWDSAGGQLSIGVVDSWAGETPVTRIVFTGLTSRGDNVQEIQEAFERTLLTDDELANAWEFTDAEEDGLEPWLGNIAPHPIMEDSVDGP